MRAALIDEDGYVINVYIVPYLDFIPNLVLADVDGDIGDWWSGTDFIDPTDPLFPPREV